MKVTAFPAGKGDCLLVTSADDRTMLVDAGEAKAYREHVRPVLARLQNEGKALDLVCVSHIDDDHIGGVLQLMDDLVEWAVHDFQSSNGNDGHSTPPFPRPPDVRAVWHNGFSDQLKDNSGDVERMLSQASAVLAGSGDASMRSQAQRNAAIVQGVRQGLALSRRLGAGQLGIPLNPEFGGKMVLAGRGNGRLRLGKVGISVLAPTAPELVALRKVWDEWLRNNREALQAARARAREDERNLGNELDRLVRPLEMQARVFGARDKVTAPNLASIVLLLEEDGATALLTGDGHHRDIVAGLERDGRLDAHGHCHVNLLKVQHHGSEHNADLGFFQQVTADHYLICADGAHGNPDVGIVDLLLQARLGPGSGSSRRPFTLSVTSSSARAEGDRQKHMRKVEQLVERWQSRHPGAFKARFLGLPGAVGKKITIAL